MSMPFYVPPEQLIKDRADFARKGIARGRPIVVTEYVDGVLLIGENPGGSLHKLGEVYDNLGFAGVGRFNEFETLRVGGIRYADLKGFSYGRADVTGKGARQCVFANGGPDLHARSEAVRGRGDRRRDRQ